VSRLRALLVEDSENDGLLIARELRKGGYDLFFQRVDTLPAMAAALKQHSWDVVISDHSMPNFSAPAALALLKERRLDIPFIIVSGCIGEEVAVAAMKAGAHDYMLKSDLVRLVPAIQRELREAEIRNSRKHAEAAQQETEARTQAILENAADAIITIDESDDIESINASAGRVFGYAAVEVVGQKIRALLPESADIGSAGRNGEDKSGVTCETTAVRKDGTQFPVELALSEVRFGKRCIRTAFVRDVTERKLANERIRRQVERLASLRTVELAINSSLDIGLTLNVIIDQVLTQLQVDAAAVLLLDPNTQWLTHASGRGFRTDMAPRIRIRMGESYAGRAVLDRVLVRSTNTPGESPDQLVGAMMQAESFIECYAMPLIAKGQVKGVLEAFIRTPIPAEDDWLDYFEVLAAQAALAIDNATMFDRLQRSNAELALAYDSTLEGWSRALDMRDRETVGHTNRVTDKALELSRSLGMSDTELLHIRRGALLHDIGKLAIPDAILQKPGPLTDDEWKVMRLHPVYAHEWLSPISFLRHALDIPYCHHEKWDGSGYPQGLKEDHIPLSARVFAIVDVWDALMSDRPYREAWPKAKVRDHIAGLSGTHFDPKIVEPFLSLGC
jgi:PAS domain S-box-containing protein